MLREGVLLQRYWIKYLLFLFVFVLLYNSSIFASRLMPISEVRPGMRGVAKTVFKGTNIDTFPVEVIGILKKAISDVDMILIKVESPYLKQRGLGLVRGMSGSPVYISGRLVGAIAYGWGFTKEAVAGVVPIHAMLSELPLTPPLSGSSTSYVPETKHIKLSSPIRIGGRKIDNVVALPVGTPFSALKYKVSKMASDTAYLMPLGTLCQVSGLSESGIARLKSGFPYMDFVSFSGGSDKLQRRPITLQEGAAVGVELVRGDFSVTAIGTLSYREGDKVLAFGHPMTLLGNVDYPLALASIAYVLPSIEFPSKFGSTIKEIGHIKEDRLYAVGGILGKRARVVPMSVTVYDKGRNKKKSFNVEIVHHPQLLELATALVVERALESTAQASGEGSAEVEYALHFQGLPVLHKKNLVYNETNLGRVVLNDMERSLLELVKNDFKKLHLNKIELSIRLRKDTPIANLQRVIVSKRYLEPGEPVKLMLELKPFNSPLERREITIPLPKDLSGQVMIGISGGIEYEKIRKIMGISTVAPVTLDQLFNNLAAKPAYNLLTIQLSLPRRAAILSGEKYLSLPPHLLDIMEASGISGITSQPDELVQNIEMPWIIIGSQTVDIVVGKKDKDGIIFPQSKKREPMPHPQPDAKEESFAFDLSTSAGFQSKRVLSPVKPTLLPSPSIKQEDKKIVRLVGKRIGIEQVNRINQWDRGVFHGVALTDAGSLTLAPFMKERGSLPEPFILSIAEDQKNSVLYVGTAFPGKIYKYIPGTGLNLFFDPKAGFVNALVAAPNGELFAGLSGGDVLHFDNHGSIKHKYSTGEQHVWALLLDPQGVLYAGTGGKQGKIMRAFPFQDKSFTTIAAFSQSHVLSLAIGKEGELYGGTSNSGILAKISRNGNVTLLYAAQGSAVTALDVAQDGTLYFGTSPDGKIYERKTDGRIAPYYKLPDSHIVSLVSLDKGELLAGTGRAGSLYKILPPGKAVRLVKGEQMEYGMLFLEKKGRYFVTFGSSGRIVNMEDAKYAAEGEFVSPVIDSGDLSKWGTMTWNDSIPQNTHINVETRVGNSPILDESWSSWRPVLSNKFIGDSSARYLQYRIILSSDDGKQSPVVSQLQLYYRNVNRPPQISLVAPLSGEFISKKVSIKVKTNDPDEDILALSFWYIPVKELNEEEIWKKIGEQFTAGVPVLPIPGSAGEEITQEWDTTKLHDGRYRLKIVASDFPNNLPSEEAEAQIESKEFVVDNTPPSLTVVTKEFKKEDPIFLEGIISDNLSPIKELLFKLPAQEKEESKAAGWRPAIPVDGLFDSREEKFVLRITPLPSGTHTLEIKGIDLAGNEVIKKITITILN